MAVFEAFPILFHSKLMMIQKLKEHIPVGTRPTKHRGRIVIILLRPVIFRNSEIGEKPQADCSYVRIWRMRITREWSGE